MNALKLKLAAVAKRIKIKIPVRVFADVHHKVRMKLVRLKMGSFANWVRVKEDEFTESEK